MCTVYCNPSNLNISHSGFLSIATAQLKLQTYFVESGFLFYFIIKSIAPHPVTLNYFNDVIR